MPERSVTTASARFWKKLERAIRKKKFTHAQIVDGIDKLET
jgi:predicted DNA-binding ribbon-helix-helix protein